MSDEIPNRYELKYIVPVSLVPAIRRAIEPFCALDRFAAASPTRRYVITSLYLDSDTHELFRQKEEMAYHRSKIRVRTYGERSDGPVFLEVKRKFGDTVAKSRARVPEDDWKGWALRGEGVAADFHSAMRQYEARPVLLARYEREAHVSQVDTYARVTLDHRIEWQACTDWDLLGAPRLWMPGDDIYGTKGVRDGVVLELKSTHFVPRWMIGLVRRFDLLRCGYSKYCAGIERLFWGTSGQAERVARFGGW